MFANQPILARGCELLVAGMGLYGALQGLRKGTMPFVYDTVKRSEDPFLFWFSVVVWLLGAIAFLLVAIGYFAR